MDQRPEPEIKIEITGNRAHIGKTAVAHVIFAALLKAGVKNITFNTEDSKQATLLKLGSANTVPDPVKDVRVVINDNPGGCHISELLEDGFGTSLTVADFPAPAEHVCGQMIDPSSEM